MRKLYGSFLVRCWDLGHEARVEVEHIQSGTRIVASTFAEATRWMRDYCRDSDAALADCAKGGPEPNDSS